MSLACDRSSPRLRNVMQIHVARNSAQLGIFTPEEIIAGLQSGRFHAADLAWREGMAAWTPLGDWSEFRGVGAPPIPCARSRTCATAVTRARSPSVTGRSCRHGSWAASSTAASSSSC
ncbi:MAG: DUF4339 domain-containing protein [Acidimicrobiia bacterium]|nr:DUF4339 domain-containing protein [Acidimicrobiia bacterium]